MKPYKKKKHFREFVTSKDNENFERGKRQLKNVNFDQVKVNQDLFSDTKLSSISKVYPKFVSHIERVLSISNLTTIQEKSINHILDMKNVLLKSVTGSGKTLAFLIPVIQNLLGYTKNVAKVSRQDGTFIIIISPTRELSLQTFNVLKKITSMFPWIVSGLITGGANVKSEKKGIRKGMTVVVGTPGRILYHLKNTSSFLTSKLKHFILDEADLLLSMGFKKDVDEIYDIISSRSELQSIQTILVSATLDENVRELCQSLVGENYVFIGEDNQHDIPEKLNQFYMRVPCKLRWITLVSLLLRKTDFSKDFENEEKGKVIVFFGCCSSVDYHYELLKKFRLFGSKLPLIKSRVCKLHGNMPQNERKQTYEDFLKAKSGILITTDVFSRGMDLPAVKWIIQYDPPGNPKDYLHRATRTSRIGNEGNAILFLMPHEMAYLSLLQKSNFQISSLSGEKVIKETLKLVFPDKKFKKNDPLQQAYLLMNEFCKFVRDDKSLNELAIQAYKDFLRAYSTHSREVKFIFHVNNLHYQNLAKSLSLFDSPEEKRRGYDRRNNYSENKNSYNGYENNYEDSGDYENRRERSYEKRIDDEEIRDYFESNGRREPVDNGGFDVVPAEGDKTKKKINVEESASFKGKKVKFGKRRKEDKSEYPKKRRKK